MKVLESVDDTRDVVLGNVRIHLDVLNRGSRFAAIRIATGSQRFQIA